MSRLEEALERAKVAQARPAPEPVDASADDWVDDTDPSEGAAPRAIESFEAAPVAKPQPTVTPWQFDAALQADERVEPPPAPVERPAAEGNPTLAGYTFGEVALGKTIVGPDAESGLIEQYRRLAASLHHVQLRRGVRTLMVTSAVASEGKTLTATNLALTLSQSYKRRVLLIDADLRRPAVHEVFRIPNTAGLGDVLRNPESRQLPLARVSTTLWALTAGRPDGDPMGLLVSEEMRQLLTEATEVFDWVIVDTPPVALLSDANLLAAMIDASILVVGAASTPYPLVRRAIDSVGAERILGIVLNRIERSQMVGGYGYYGYYGYAKNEADSTSPAAVAVATPAGAIDEASPAS